MLNESEKGTHNDKDQEEALTDQVRVVEQADSASETSDVTAAPTIKVCPKCSVQTQTSGNFCPHCGASYAGKSALGRINKKVALIAAGILVVAGAGTGITLGVQHANQVEAERVAAAAQKAEEKAAAEAKRLAEEEAAAAEAAALEEQESAEAAEKLIRATIVSGLEESVQKDAKERVNEGVLTGPIKRTECTPLGGGSVDDLTAITGTFECIAVNEERKDGSASGYVFSATVNWDEASYSWHLGR